jgi:hypothetical protein
MANPQIIRSPSGEELIVPARAEYDALVAAASGSDEDIDDVTIYDARKAEMADSGLLPAAVSAALLRGDSRLKAIRKWRRLGRSELAHKAGIGQGYLSDLAGRRRKGTPETIARLASVLDVPAIWLD